MGRGHRDKISDILRDMGDMGDMGTNLGYIIGTNRGLRATFWATFWATLICVALVKTFKKFEYCVYLF
jgi:hypothetical protein